ncbi:MAG TPA: cation:proton antiporter [Candidatus Saccharimonadales bacterium]
MYFGTVFPSVSHDAMLLFLVQLTVVLSSALLLGLLARRFGLPMIVGELLAGVLLGPSLLGWIAPGLYAQLFPGDIGQAHLLNGLGQLGVLLLVGLSGMQMNTWLIRKQRRAAIKVSMAGLFVPLALGIIVGWLLPEALMGQSDRLTFALFMGVALCVSALPVIAKTFLDMGLMNHKTCQLALVAAVIDDAFGWTMLSIVSAMAIAGAQLGFIAWSILKLILVMVVMLTIGRKIIHWIIDAVARFGNGDGNLVTALAAIILASALLTHALGLEAIFGAFISGIILGTHKKSRNIRLPTVLSVLVPVFFVTAALRMDLTLLAKPVVLVSALIVVAAAIIGKFAGAYFGARLSHLSRRDAVILGASLNARGVIEVIIAAVGMRLGILTVEAYTIIVLVAIVTSLMAPPLLRYATKGYEGSGSDRGNWPEPL